MSSNTSDEKDLERIAAEMQSGSEDAFREFSDHFNSRLKGFFLRYGLSDTQAADLTVSCITDISIRIHSYQPRPGSRFLAWVFTLARNTAIDWHRRNNRAISFDDAELIEFVSCESQDTAIDLAIVAAIGEGMAQLSATDRQIIKLRDFEPPHSYQEIQELLGIKASAARVRLLRAHRNLAEILEQDPRIAPLLRSDQINQRNKKNEKKQSITVS